MSDGTWRGCDWGKERERRLSGAPAIPFLKIGPPSQHYLPLFRFRSVLPSTLK